MEDNSLRLNFDTGGDEEYWAIGDVEFWLLHVFNWGTLDQGLIVERKDGGSRE